MNRLSVYISSEILKPFMVVSFILAGLFTSFNAARYLAETVTETLGMILITKLIILKTIIAMEVLLPIAFYASIIVALGRLHRDQEVIVLKSAGISENLIVKVIFNLCIPVGILVGLLSIFGRPWAYEMIYQLDESASTQLDVSRYQARRFYGDEESDSIIYVENKNNNNEATLEGVFHYIRKNNSSDIIIARQGFQEPAVDYSPPKLHLLDGYMYRMDRSSTRDSIIKFSRFVYMPSPETARDYQRKAASTLELNFSQDPRDIAEFQWRISRAFSTILLAMVAIPLARSSPRQGKSEKIIAAAVIFAIYYNLSGLAQTWVEQGLVGKFPGVWWLHLLMLVAVLLVFSPKVQKSLQSG
jgi:lipopolysaccharide export system permease protein